MYINDTTTKELFLRIPVNEQKLIFICFSFSSSFLDLKDYKIKSNKLFYKSKTEQNGTEHSK